VRFLPDGGYLRLLGISPVAERDRLLGLFRTVRDQIAPRPASKGAG
jgi:hypothetical protein